MNGIMIDLETLDLKPTALVLQLGYAIADMSEKKILAKGLLNLDRDSQSGRSISVDTVSWWARQDPAVIDSVFFPVDICWGIEDSLQHLSSVILQADIKEVWAAPASFDLTILRNLWGEVPWDRRQQRDMVTLRERLDSDRKLEPPPNIMQHNAMADAVWQMDYLFNLLEKMHG